MTLHMNAMELAGLQHIWSTYALMSLGQSGVLNACISALSPNSPPPPHFFFCFHFSGRPFSVSSLWFQLFVIIVWNFELYMIPLALLLPLVWNYILLVSGKDTRQDVVSNLIASLVSLQRGIKPTTSFLETWYYLTQMHESNLRHCRHFNLNNLFSVGKKLVT